MRFLCDHCQKVLKARAEHAGRRGNCPHCKGPVTVPTAQQAAEAMARRQATRKHESEAHDDPFAQFIVYDLEDTELVYETDSRAGRADKRPVDYSKVAVARSILYVQGALLGLVALVSFTLGVLVGLNAASQGEGQAEVATSCIVTGRVTYRNGAHQREPDEGAVVIILPKDAKPERQAAPYGLRPDDEMPDENHEGLWTIREIGGDYARADENGQYQLRVKNARSYYILYISKRMDRPRGQQLAKADLAQIGSYFLPAQDLIGRNQYQWGQVASIRGSQKRLKDVVFQ